MPNLKSLVLLVSEIWPKEFFDDDFKPEGGATWSPKCSQLVSSIVYTYIVFIIAIAQTLILFLIQ